MKVAFVHDRIVAIWWAEKVFFDLIKKEQFDEWKIFTVFSNKKFIQINWKDIQIESVISNNFIINKIWYRNLMPFFPILIKILSYKINKYKPDNCIISSFSIAKNIDFKWFKKLYLHSPMQYIWDHYDEYINKFSWIKQIIYKLCSKYLRVWDKKYTQFNEIVCNSEYTQTLAKKIYWIDGTIQYPQIQKEFLQTYPTQDIHDYYIYIWRLVKFVKELDKIINLFNHSNQKLLIVWTGPDELFLKSIAWPNIIFLWFLDQENNPQDLENLIKILKHSKWLINITKESFGIVTAQALALGVPVFGYNKWASTELVDEKSGILIDNKNYENIQKWFEKFQNTNFDRENIKQNFLKKYLK